VTQIVGSWKFVVLRNLPPPHPPVNVPFDRADEAINQRFAKFEESFTSRTEQNSQRLERLEESLTELKTRFNQEASHFNFTATNDLSKQLADMNKTLSTFKGTFVGQPTVASSKKQSPRKSGERVVSKPFRLMIGVTIEWDESLQHDQLLRAVCVCDRNSGETKAKFRRRCDSQATARTSVQRVQRVWPQTEHAGERRIHNIKTNSRQVRRVRTEKARTPAQSARKQLSF
jgi:hypothetical protein